MYVRRHHPPCYCRRGNENVQKLRWGSILMQPNRSKVKVVGRGASIALRKEPLRTLLIGLI